MILGPGSARTEKAITAEYHRFLQENSDVSNPEILFRLRGAPFVMRRRIGKPLADWRDEDILALYSNRTKTTWYPYNAFLAFLFLRGYRRASLEFITRFSLGLVRFHRHALAAYRQKLEKTRQELGYSSGSVGTELNLLIILLAVVYKPLNEITRSDFEAFRDEYQRWYQSAVRRQDRKGNARLSRLEFYLVHWRIIPPATRVFRHEQHFARLQHQSIRTAITAFMAWCDAKYQPSTIDSRRAALLNFFLWFQDNHPGRGRLDEVTRPIALAYAQYLKQERERGHYAQIYCNDLYRSLRLFYEFAIREELATSPHRNPFALGDLPRPPDPLPRYLTDQEVRQILAYCDKDATPKERTLVITLFHTGVRAAELASLKASDIVQIQGKWKLHIHAGKGLKDRMIPLTPQCLATLQAWQANGWEHIDDRLFTWYGRPLHGTAVSTTIRDLGLKLGIHGLTPHRFRHTFAVTLLNYGMRESALQKVMGHTTLNMTLEYARILDQTVEQSFAVAVSKMQEGPTQWIPSFFTREDYTLLAEGDTLNWIRLPLGYCRRNPQLHCEGDVKCLLCDRFAATPEDLPRFKAMCERFEYLGMPTKVEIVKEQIHQLEQRSDRLLSPSMAKDLTFFSI